jgi:hypothetical protein
VRLAIGYSTKNQIELSEQTWPRLIDSLPLATHNIGLFWADASSKEDAIGYFEEYKNVLNLGDNAQRVFGGADAAIAWKLSKMLAAEENYTHIMLLENDVLLDEDWFAPTFALFEKGKADGMDIGAVSPRSYVDRCLIQRDGYACMHNMGAGVIVFTREAADIVLRSFRTGWWPDNVRIFAQLSGIDLRTYAAFRGNEQTVTTDWQFESQLARHGLASLALTPARCQMVGQTPSLAEQGLALTTGSPHSKSRDEPAFETFRTRLHRVRQSDYQLVASKIIHQTQEGQLFFPHQLGNLAGGATWSGQLGLKWSQGFGPFAYRAGPGGASLSLRASGICSFLLTGGDTGAAVTIEDTRSGFKFAPQLPAMMEQAGSINVPGSPVLRQITMQMQEGAVFYGLACTDPQMLDDKFRFDWSQLPEAT